MRNTTRKAVQAGGVTLGRTYHAKDYGPMLKNAGFSAIGALEEPREGDVIIIQPYANGNPSGHMAIYDGHDWYSELQQETCGPVRVIGPQSRHTPLQEEEVMKAFPLIVLILLICGCTPSHRDSTQDVKQFYLSWMKNYTQDPDAPREH